MSRISLIIFFFTSITVLRAQDQKSYEVTFKNGNYKRTPFSKAYLAEELYENKKIKFKGRFLKCTSRQGYIDVYEKRKIGRWIYYYPNGNISRIESYTTTTSCDTKIHKDGKWQYFNPTGELYFEELFKNDTVVASTMEVYRDSILYRKIVRLSTTIDTVEVLAKEKSANLVLNGDFELYYHKPVLVLNDGHNAIQQLIPSWYSHGVTSPDYYHTNRKVVNVPKHFNDSLKETGAVGVMLYNSRDEQYAEHLQTKLKYNLKQNQKYCLTFDLMLSINAGYYTEKVDALFSSDAISVPSNFSPPDSLQYLAYHSTLDNTNGWQQICNCFIANGTEQYLTLGLFSLTEAGVTKTTERYFSSLDINAGAYYLFDNVVVKPVSESYDCAVKPIIKPRKTSFKLKENVFAALLTGKAESIAFKNVQFETNKSDLRPASFPELDQLRYFLENSNVTIEIAGYTDNVGTDEHNQTLSQARAESIKSWLSARGIAGERLVAQGYGASNFVADNTTEENRKLNRRVEIRLVNQ